MIAAKTADDNPQAVTVVPETEKPEEEPEGKQDDDAQDLDDIVVPAREDHILPPEVLADSIAGDSIMDESIRLSVAEDSAMTAAGDSIPDEFEQRKNFVPDPTRAVWLSALCPGLGQIYNRRYWKLPIVIGGYVGLAYATSWNSRMLNDYTQAYRDIMDSDPNTHSYMDFYPSTVTEDDLDMEWLQRSLQSRRNFYRRNRDLCIICMVGLYLLCMVDAYVDASLSQFNISPDLSMQVAPAVIESRERSTRAVGVQCALTF